MRDEVRRADLVEDRVALLRVADREVLVRLTACLERPESDLTGIVHHAPVVPEAHLHPPATY
ncbi:MAG: hypothetical protein E6J90_25650 [Deltaproteobacteria bacterium]|nr:MAG: hypothetical protein E6J90_25650 [Deltaproteobacteria bacterium]